MLIHYAYFKLRSQFGKQCIFEKTDPVMEENIFPNPKLMQDYIHRNRCNRSVQESVQLSLHEMQTITKPTKESGMLHLEGGWPKEINVKDEEAVRRFRRRVEKDDNWAPRMKKLTDPIEHCMLQNNTINIYENYFDDTVPSSLVVPRDVRITSVFADPQPVVRPVNHLSWSPVVQNRLAASYSFVEFETKPVDVIPCSYIWNIENPNAPVMRLESSLPLTITEFNPYDPSLLISGLMSGQVCNWDIRIGNRPVQMSRRQFSHRNPANQALWITSKTNTKFLSASIDGTVKWWDIRKLAQPTEELVMDLDNPLRADRYMAIGITALQYESTMSNRFLVGTENGLVINVNQKSTNLVDKLATRFNAHVGPVIVIERNPFLVKNFLTLGDWNVKIWADDTKEDCLIAIREQDADLSGGCWSRSRCSVFFTINTAGLLKVYDILTGVESPTTTFRVCNESLTAIAAHKDGELLAIGSHDGNIYLAKCSEGHTVATKTDKANLIAYLERCSRFEKTVDARLKESRLMQPAVREHSAAQRSPLGSKDRQKKGDRKERTQVKGEQHRKMKSRLKKEMRGNAFFEDLADTEAEFFQAVEKEIASYPILEGIDIEKMISLQTLHKKKKREVLRELMKVEKIVATKAKKRKSAIRNKRERPKKFPTEEMELDKVEEVAKIERPSAKKRRGKKIPRKVCSIEVCVPEICCADLEEKLRTKLRARKLSPREKKSSRDVTPRKLSDLAQKLAHPSAIGKRSILLEEDECTLANILADEVREAKREVRAWQETVASRKRDAWRARMTDVIVREKSHGKKRKVGSGDDESPVRDTTEGRSDFRQLAETSTGAWKPVSESEDEISRERGKEQTSLILISENASGKAGRMQRYTSESTETMTTTTMKTGSAASRDSN